MIKAVDQIKTTLKDTSSFIEDIDNEKMVMESKFRQLSEKTVLVKNQSYELDCSKHTLEENYNKLKQLYKSSKEEVLETKY